MDTIKFGSEVRGTTGTLGHVSGMIADAHTRRVDQLLVKHGFLFADQRMVPLTHVARVEGNVVYVNLDEAGLETMEPFTTEAYRAPDPDPVGPPTVDQQGTFTGNFEFTRQVASNPVDYGANKPFSYPGGENLVPVDKRLPVLTNATPVLDANSATLGELSQLCVDPVGVPAQITVSRGVLFKHEEDLPLDWFDNFTVDGLTLNVPKEQVDAVFDTASETPAPAVENVDPYAAGSKSIVEDS